MSNPRKARGTKWEVEVRDRANHVLQHRAKAYRPAQEGYKDTGDIHGVSPFVIQAKDWRDIVSALREGLGGAVQQAKNANERWGVAVIKRARKKPGEAYTVMRLDDWLAFFADYLDLRAENERLRTRLSAYRERSTDEQPDHRPHRRG